MPESYQVWRFFSKSVGAPPAEHAVRITIRVRRINFFIFLLLYRITAFIRKKFLTYVQFSELGCVIVPCFQVLFETN